MTGGTYTSVSGSWAVPNPTSTNPSGNSSDAAWVGIGGINSSDLIQAGTIDIVSPSGAVSVEAFYEMLPNAAKFIPTISVSPGDTMSASVAQTSSGVWGITVTDATTGQSFNTSVSYASSFSSAEWIQEDPSDASGNLMTLDNFGTISFSGARTTVNGALTTPAASNASSITMLNASHTPVAVPSTISSGLFHVTYQ